MVTSKWPNGSDPWAVWRNRAPRLIEPEAERTPAEAETTASLAGMVLQGHLPTDEEAKSLAASVLSSKARQPQQGIATYFDQDAATRSEWARHGDDGQMVG